MPEARDRRTTPLDVATIFARRRASFSVLDDFDPFTPGSSPAGLDRLLAPRTTTVRGRALALRTPGAENTPTAIARRRRRGRAPLRSVLPAWYPRTPLRDITTLARAMERRRIPLGVNSEEGERTPALRDHSSVPGARLEHRGDDSSGVSPSSVSVKIKTCSKVPKIVLQIAEEEGESEEFLTPQKKLLESIDTVEKVVREELQRLKRTPSGRKAEREKRVRTLMSMR